MKIEFSKDEGAESCIAYEDDGLPIPRVGEWAIIKHRKVAYYASLFSQSMKLKWNTRVCLELFAGGGLAQTKKTNKIIPGSPLVTLGINTPFDRYVFCEQDPQLATALKARIDRHFPTIEAKVVNTEANTGIASILGAIPSFSATNKGLTLCFVDPFKAAQLQFKTLETISNRLLVDFVVLIPSFMDIHRNEKNYTRPDNHTLDIFLGTDDWRDPWEKASRRAFDFGCFVADYFGKRMSSMGYIYSSIDDYEAIRIGENRSLYLYHLGFFSKSKLGVKFWSETRKNTNSQMSLF